MEQAYDRLPEPGEGGSGGDGDESCDSSDTGDDGDDEDGSPQGPDGSSGAPPSHDPSGTGEVMDADSRGGQGSGSSQAPANTAAEEQAWDEAIHQALSIAKAEGKVPGSVEETVRNAHASTLDWRTLLRRYMTDAAGSDYSWSAPNRRFIDSGLYLPSIRSEGIDSIAVIIDTSGSVPVRTLGEFWAELREIVSEIRPGSDGVDAPSRRHQNVPR